MFFETIVALIKLKPNLPSGNYTHGKTQELELLNLYASTYKVGPPLQCKNMQVHICLSSNLH